MERWWDKKAWWAAPDNLTLTSFSDLPVPGTPILATPRPNFSDSMRGASYDISQRMVGAANSIAEALMTPGNAMRGEYSYAMINPDGSVDPVSAALIEPAANLAGIVSMGSLPMTRPSGSLGMGGRPKSLPSSESLFTPPPPTAELMGKLGRVERVPISQARGTNSLQWERFDAGDHPQPLIRGFEDKPVAVRRENGEYVIYDGHHRTALAASRGEDTIDMYVIDAKDYAPSTAGKASSAAKWSAADDDLLRELGF